MKRTQDERLEGAAFTARREKRGQWSYWVTLPFAEGWVAAQRLDVQQGVLVVTELRVFPREQLRPNGGEWSQAVASVPRGGITAAMLRTVSIGGRATAPVVTDWIEAILSSRPDREGVAIDHPPAHRRLAQRVRQELSVRSEPLPPKRSDRGRKPTRTRSFYDGIAKDYRRLHRTGPDVAKRLADERGANRNTVRTWIHIARTTHQLLPRTTQGKLPGELLQQDRPLRAQKQTAGRKKK